MNEMEVTLAGTSSLLLWYRSPEHTRLLPPSTAHKPGSAPANDTAPRRQERRQALRPFYSFFNKKQSRHGPVQTLTKRTHETIDADALAVVDTRDGCDNIVEEDLRESLAHHRFLQGLIQQSKKTIAAHGVKELIHAGEGVTVLLVLVDPACGKVSRRHLH